MEAKTFSIMQDCLCFYAMQHGDGVYVPIAHHKAAENNILVVVFACALNCTPFHQQSSHNRACLSLFQRQPL